MIPVDFPDGGAGLSSPNDRGETCIRRDYCVARDFDPIEAEF
jgi:hypothetical protein